MSSNHVLPSERRGGDQSNVKTYLSTAKRQVDPKDGSVIVKIFSGDFYVTKADEMLVTILGSCVAACIRDPQAGVGGMNHFLLPGEEGVTNQLSDSNRYGVFAMESLINGILKWGGRKDRLEVKVFGGGNVINNSARIGSKNAEFIRGYLQKEGIRIASQDLEGDYPRRIHYFPLTGKLLMRQLKRREDLLVVEEEKRYKQTIASKPVEGNIELF